MTKRTEIIVDTHRLLVVRKRGGSMRAWCEGCRAEVPMITPNEAATLMNVSSRIVYRWIEDGRVHFIEQLGGLLVCAEFLPVSETKRRSGC